MKKLKAAIPDGKFWIKLDATDIKTALQESMEGKLNGDAECRLARWKIGGTEN